jgi:hypothetical protein
VKVIIQDLDSRHYLSPTGQWVAGREDAEDFHTLLHAYHFARNNTNRNFQVLLYCPDDQFCSSIISGTGITALEAMPASTKVAIKRRVKAFKAVRRPQLGTDFNAGADGSRFFLN